MFLAGIATAVMVINSTIKEEPKMYNSKTPQDLVNEYKSQDRGDMTYVQWLEQELIRVRFVYQRDITY